MQEDESDSENEHYNNDAPAETHCYHTCSRTSTSIQKKHSTPVLINYQPGLKVNI